MIPTSLWRQGAGVGAAVGTAIATCITLGLSPLWLPPGGTASYFAPVVGVLSGTLLGAVCGSIIGCAVPLAETKTDATAHH
jgi:hypothetical protein